MNSIVLIISVLFWTWFVSGKDLGVVDMYRIAWFNTESGGQKGKLW